MRSASFPGRPLRRFATRLGASIVSPRSRPTLMESVAFQSIVSARPVVYWFPTPAMFSSFPNGTCGFYRSPSPTRFRKWVHPLLSFPLLQSTAVSSPPHIFRCEAPPLGLRLPLRGITERHSHGGLPSPPPFRPRRFSRPRRLAPPLGLRVCFTPQPRPGFTLQGFSLTNSRLISSMSRALSSFGAAQLNQVAPIRHRASLRPQGFDPSVSPLPVQRGLAAAPARSPPELHLLQVFPR